MEELNCAAKKNNLPKDYIQILPREPYDIEIEFLLITQTVLLMFSSKIIPVSRMVLLLSIAYLGIFNYFKRAIGWFIFLVEFEVLHKTHTT